MTAKQLQTLRNLIDAGEEEKFYSWKVWERLSIYVRTRLDNNECQKCKSRGKFGRAEIVHHIKHLKDRPDLALSVYDPDTGERQLESRCRVCHEEDHPERMRPARGPAATPLTEERWD